MGDPFATACTECDPCRLHVAKLDMAMAGIMDILHAERESHAAQVSAMLEERASVERERDTYRSMLCDLVACHGRVRLGGEFDGELWARARVVLATGEP